MPKGGNRIRHATLPCKHCGVLMPEATINSRYCHDCIHPPGHPENVKARHRLSRYGVDKNMWAAMLFEQDWLCAVPACSNKAEYLDHDHATGKPRGILCNYCNAGLGYVENTLWVLQAQEYLQ